MRYNMYMARGIGHISRYKYLVQEEKRHEDVMVPRRIINYISFYVYIII